MGYICSPFLYNKLPIWSIWLIGITLFIALSFYCILVWKSNKYLKVWLIYKSLSWLFGIILIFLSLVGPLGDRAHIDFKYHMVIHLILGMLAPLFLATASPLFLLLRSISVREARSITKILRKPIFGFYTNPIVTTILNVGGLWILYTTKLFELMHHNPYIYLLIHFHVLLAGYLFTISIIYYDPIFHRKSYIFRAVVFIIAFALHSILTKYIYSHPPVGVSPFQAEQGALIMYYGGDFIEIMMIIILLGQWYSKTKPKYIRYQHQNY